eukprot:6380372-Prymnesium_polylepis.1
MLYDPWGGVKAYTDHRKRRTRGRAEQQTGREDTRDTAGHVAPSLRWSSEGTGDTGRRLLSPGCQGCQNCTGAVRRCCARLLSGLPGWYHPRLMSDCQVAVSGWRLSGAVIGVKHYHGAQAASVATRTTD